MGPMRGQLSWMGLFRVRPSVGHTHRISSTRTLSSPTGVPVHPRRAVTFLSVATTVSVASTFYALGSIYPPELATFISPRPGPPSPVADSPEGIARTAEVESSLQSLPIVKQLRQQTEQFYETRPFADYPEEKRIHSFTSGSLRAPGRLAVPPLLFAKRDDSETIVIVHVGRSLCGHDGIVHGGLLATLLDESMARTALVNLPGRIGVTANLSLNYRAPTKADQFLKITTQLIEQKGRKVVVSGRVEDLGGKVLVDATSTFVEPRYAGMLKNPAIDAALGRPSGTAGVSGSQEVSP
ncbi:hypothetical protein BS47DRAFT_1326160 [Hydnum rufescens UP504]|uniref:Thioesterase domain-containing protein n=1 Tax=Hydnum rufescens UP504 TaxID=1448309 RepID=A0A9P6DZX1_9AGAM|nr:hypothetical protein BS47DRAFT_1326160 [Hydnum rufescens UP504]